MLPLVIRGFRFLNGFTRSTILIFLYVEFSALPVWRIRHQIVNGCPMEQINEALYSALFLSLNPLAWVMAVIFSKKSGQLRKPVIAAVITQTGICCLLIALIVWSGTAFPVSDIFTLLLIPCVLSGILISAIVILFTKPRRLRQVFSSRRVDQMTFKSV